MTMGGQRLLWVLLAGFACAFVTARGAASPASPASSASAQPTNGTPRGDRGTPNANLFSDASQAISRGAYTEAIDLLELLADRGFVHPDASFNRGLAYLARARSSVARPGDHGRAAASLRETLLLRPEDEAARALLEEVREELARKHARTRAGRHIEAPAPSRALVGLLHENTWATLALLFSATTALGFALRWPRRTGTPLGAARLAGSILAGVGALGLALTGAATAVAQSLRNETQLAVVVAPDARLLDGRGRPLERPPLPEGTEIHLTDIDGPRARVEHGTDDVWVRRSDVRTLATSPTR